MSLAGQDPYSTAQVPSMALLHRLLGKGQHDQCVALTLTAAQPGQYWCSSFDRTQAAPSMDLVPENLCSLS